MVVWSTRFPKSPLALPAIVGGLSLFATVWLSFVTLRDQDAQLAAQVTRAAADVIGHLQTQYNTERQQLIAMGDQLSFAPEAWRNWSRPYLVGQPIHRTVFWIDRDLVVQRVDGANDPPLVGYDFSANASRAEAMRDAASAHEQVVLRADDLQRGFLSLLIAQPVYAREGFVGFTAAILDIDALLRLALRPHEDTGIAISVEADKRVVYRTAGGGDGIKTPTGGFVERAADFGPLDLQLEIWWSPAARVARGRDRVPTLMFSFGLLASTLLTIAIIFMQMARRRSEGIERVNHLLEGEIKRREHAQQELQQMAAELRRSNQELEDFAAIASHDLRAPLQKMKSFADLLDEDYKPCLDDDGRDVLQRLRRSVHRMQRLVDDLLELARVRAKGRPFTRVDLTVVAREVMSDLEAVLRATGGFIEIGELPVIDADPMQMHQLLQNLVGNGLKFQKPGEIPLVRIEGSVVDNPFTGLPLCRLRISDNGIGFDSQYAERIFRPFERLHGQHEYEGSGIGLAVCAKIAERHGGTITAQGVLGQGASFLVSLPVRHAPTVPGQRMVESEEIKV
jgi:signal transduction histidine kinase